MHDDDAFRQLFLAFRQLSNNDGITKTQFNEIVGHVAVANIQISIDTSETRTKTTFIEISKIVLKSSDILTNQVTQMGTETLDIKNVCKIAMNLPETATITISKNDELLLIQGAEQMGGTLEHMAKLLLIDTKLKANR